ncbi:MAG TPA: InlB B-repeat-containing protein, partial [Pseudolysinimonas sp.]
MYAVGSNNEKTVAKRFLTRVKAVGAVLLSTVLIAGAATVLSAPEAAHAAAGPFTCTSDFYQASAGKMYQYSVVSNTYTVMAASLNVSGLNAIGYNTGDNYIYGLSGSTLYKIGNDGSQIASFAVTGTAQTTGGDFIAANKLLSVSSAGVWSLTDTTTHAATAFTKSGSTWAAYDLAYNPTNHTVYGMDGTTLYIGVVTGTTSVAVTTKAVTGSLAGSGDSWGASYVDSAGDAYFFDNTTHNLVEISAAGLASASPSALSITQANSLATPNDGASCPTASSPLAPTVTTTAATSITTTTAVLNGTVATGLPTGSDVPSGGIVICYSTSATVTAGALSVSPVCAAATPSSLAINTAATAVTRSVSGLTAGTTYYVQVQATNSFGLAAYANVVSFTTVAANHTVTFNNNGGTGTMANEVTNAATALTTNSFTRVGYTFSGWNTAANGSGTAYANGASYPFTADATMYAQWTALPNHTVTFNNNGGTGTMTNEVNNVAAALTTDTFTRAGYSFSGWNTAANGSGTAYADAASYPFTADVTLYAQWTALPNHTVTFNNNGGTGTMANEVHNVATALTTDTFTRLGYTFSGWNTAANGSGTAYADAASYPFTADVTLYAQWTALPNHTVTFNNNGGTGTMANEVNNIAAALTTDTFTRLGYTFSGWNTAANGSGTAYADSASYPFTADMTLYAQWTALPNHTVTFNNNGGTGTMTNEVHNIATALTTDTFTRVGYTFSGWNTAANGSGTGYADSASYPFTADVTLYAQWTALPNHTVTFNNNGGTGTMTNEVNN